MNDFEKVEPQIVSRRAQAGDVCILLSAAPDTNGFRAQQQRLQAAFGGTLTNELHLTCQRVDPRPERLSELQSMLARLAGDFRTMPITATSVVPFYSRFRKIHVLKVGIELTAELLRFSVRLESALSGLGLPSLYRRGSQSSLVTVLEGVRDAALPVAWSDVQLPTHLYDARRIVLSRIRGIEDYERLGEVALRQ
jgi:2'-5' RNA ligase